VYESSTVADNASARSFLNRLRDGSARLPDAFTAREVRRKGWSGMIRPDESENACEVLVDHGWLIATPQVPTERGGRPTITYRLNPRALIR
jgi:hypothetical protein